MNKNALPYALGAILLGVVGIWFHDFALNWQPVPKDLPAYGLLAYVSGLLLIAGGVAVLSRKGERWGALLLASFFGLWVIALHLPNAIKAYQHIYAWLGPAESGFACLGGVALFASGAGALRISTGSTQPPAWCRRGSRRTRRSGPGRLASGISPPDSRW
jgi:uncharacterized membrane protein